MNKIATIFLIFLFLIPMISFPIHSIESVQSNTIYVDDDNNDGPWDG